RRCVPKFGGRLSLQKWQASAKHEFYLCRQNARKCLIISGVPGGIRTPNLLIRSQKLYPVELQAHFAKSQAPNSKSQSRSGNFGAWSLRFGACEAGVADGTRTRNNQNHNLGLYHSATATIAGCRF